MEAQNKVAVYMDHFIANIIEYKQEATVGKTIKSEFNHFEKEKILQKGESHLHHKEQDFQQKFYEQLKEELLTYDSILLFGATNAKTELLHILQANTKFLNAIITLKNTDKLTLNQQVEFVNNFFYIQ